MWVATVQCHLHELSKHYTAGIGKAACSALGFLDVLRSNFGALLRDHIAP